MPNYKCKRCQYSTKNKSIYFNHLNRKFPCNAKFQDIPISVLKEELAGGNYSEYEIESKIESKESKMIEIESNIESTNKKKSYMCYGCGQCFSTSSNRSKHINKVCKGIKSNISSLQDLKKENEEMKAHVLKVEKDNEIMQKKIDTLQSIVEKNKQYYKYFDWKYQYQ